MIMHFVPFRERLLLTSTIFPQAKIVGLDVTKEQRLKGAKNSIKSHTQRHTFPLPICSVLTWLISSSSEFNSFVHASHLQIRISSSSSSSSSNSVSVCEADLILLDVAVVDGLRNMGGAAALAVPVVVEAGVVAAMVAEDEIATAHSSSVTRLGY